MRLYWLVKEDYIGSDGLRSLVQNLLFATVEENLLIFALFSDCIIDFLGGSTLSIASP